MAIPHRRGQPPPRKGEGNDERKEEEGDDRWREGGTEEDFCGGGEEVALRSAVGSRCRAAPIECRP